MLPLLLAVAAAAHQNPFADPIQVAQPIRLEMTPTLDGKIDTEEWDPFGTQTYLQWEPGKIYAAAVMPAGKDLVVSIDGKGDGWLVGRDNIEFRVTLKDGKPVVTARELDATVVKAPIWRDRHDLEMASSAVASSSGDQTTVEAVFDDAGANVLPRKPAKLMMRFDVVDSTADSAPYIPRTCVPIQFDDDRSVALPKGMTSGVEARTRAVVPGEDLALRFDFHGSNALGVKTIDLRTLGVGENSANRLSILFPNFDNKGRAFVDYRSKIDPAATVGYRVVRGTLTFADGAPGIVEASYRVAPLLEFVLLKTSFDRLPDDNTLHIHYVLQMLTGLPSEGVIHIEPPAGWQVVKGDGDKFKLLGGQSAEAREFLLKAPSDAHGTFLIKFTGQTKDRSASSNCYITLP